MQAGAILDDPVLKKIAKAHGKTTAQVILRWNIQTGVVAIPKSVKPHRLAENGDVFDFMLSEAELSAINGLDRNQRKGADPFNFGF